MAQTYSDKPTLEAWNAMAQTIAGAGNCRIAFGTYTGDATYGESHPNTLTFDFEPKLVIVQDLLGSAMDVPADLESKSTMLMIRGLDRFYFCNMNQYVILTWEGNSVSWYNTQSPRYQHNSDNADYLYLAIG